MISAAWKMCFGGRRMKNYLFACIIGLSGVAAEIAVPQVAQAEVGVFAAANRDLTGTRPSEAPRPLFLQDKVVANERILATKDGGGQILFLDQSSLTISPNSDIVLDKYVYDADKDSGEIGLTVLKGAMRLVGGRITKKNAALIRTPTATIGIRGGMGSASVGDDGTTRYMHIAGISSTIETDNGELTITREGGYAEISPNGDIEYLGVAPPGFVQSAYSGRSAGQGNGGGEADTDRTAEGVDNVEDVVSADEEATEQQPISTSGEQQTAADDSAFDTAENDASDESNETLLDEVGTEFDQEIDSLFVTGTFAATIIADFDGNGTPGVAASDETFMFAYSISSDQGVVLFGLPETGDDLTVDAETLADIQAVGLDTVLARAGASSLLNETGVDGFIVSGFPLSGVSAAVDPSAVLVNAETSGLGPEDIVDPIIVERDNVPGVSQGESFAGGGLTGVQMFINENRRLTGNFEIEYDGRPDFDSLDRVTGNVDLPLTEASGFAGDIDGAVDDVRTLMEEDDIGGDRGPVLPDPNT